MAPAKRLLIVEDDAAIRSSLEDLLRAEGYDVVVADNGLEGLRLLREQSPDLVLLKAKERAALELKPGV